MELNLCPVLKVDTPFLLRNREKLGQMKQWSALPTRQVNQAKWSSHLTTKLLKRRNLFTGPRTSSQIAEGLFHKFLFWFFYGWYQLLFWAFGGYLFIFCWDYFVNFFFCCWVEMWTEPLLEYKLLIHFLVNLCCCHFRFFFWWCEA